MKITLNLSSIDIATMELPEFELKKMAIYYVWVIKPTAVSALQFGSVNFVNMAHSTERAYKAFFRKFAKKAVKNPKHTKWFIPNTRTANTRQEKYKFCPVYFRHKRFLTSPQTWK